MKISLLTREQKKFTPLKHYMYLKGPSAQTHIRSNFTVLLLRSADYVGRPFCFCSVSYYYYFSFLFFSTAAFLLGFLRHFSIDLDQI